MALFSVGGSGPIFGWRQQGEIKFWSGLESLLGTASLAVWAVGDGLGMLFPPAAEISVPIGELVSWVTGGAGTAIDCLREVASPACIIGGVAAAVGPFASPLLSTPRHAEQAALLLSKSASVLD